jgi:hypothetical protein
MKTIRALKNLELPPASTTMNYSAAIKTEAIVRLGVYNFLKHVRRIFRKPVKDETENAVSALKDAIRRMKKETEEGLVFHFKNYKENLKFQYIFKLVDAVSETIYDAMMERFHDYTQDLSQLTGSMVSNQVDKDHLSASLQAAASMAGEISGEMARFSDGLEKIAASDTV